MHERIDDSEKKRAIVLKRILSLHTLKRKESVLKLARTGENSLAIRGDEWDQNPRVLGVRNGVIDLVTGKLRPGMPEDYIKTVAPVEYQELDTPAPRWEKFLLEIFNDDVDLINYLQRLLGYGITGLSSEDAFPIFYGPRGRNGKTTLLEVVKFVIGDYAHKTRSETLLESRYAPGRGAADADTMAFRGKRIIWASETGDGRSLSVARIKELAGGDTLNARVPYGKRVVEFTPTHLLILLTNMLPNVPANDEAFWHRIHAVPFQMTFVENPRKPNEKTVDRNLFERLKEEAPGILAWLVRGCIAWQREGLNPPSSVICATASYRQDMDDLAQFIAECCVVLQTAVVQVGSFYTAYSEWCRLNSVNPATLKKVSRRMVDLGYRRDDSGRHVFFAGIGLRASDT